MEKIRDTRITVDLLSYKKSWLDWCQSQNLASSDAFRKIVARLITNQGRAVLTNQEVKIKHGQSEKPTIRKEVSMTPSEFELVKAISASEGFSVTKWIIALIRARLTSTPQFGQDELELLAKSNLQLLAIGRNLNQVAKALNSLQADNRGYLELINNLEIKIKEHTKIVSDAMTANVERWMVK